MPRWHIEFPFQEITNCRLGSTADLIISHIVSFKRGLYDLYKIYSSEYCRRSTVERCLKVSCLHSNFNKIMLLAFKSVLSDSIKVSSTHGQYKSTVGQYKSIHQGHPSYHIHVYSPRRAALITKAVLRTAKHCNALRASLLIIPMCIPLLTGQRGALASQHDKLHVS